jgi:uncharacterized protein YuzE
MKNREKHIYIKASLTKPLKNISSLEIENNCLLDIDGHSNIIEIRLENQERDFLMNKRRTFIKVNY